MQIIMGFLRLFLAGIIVLWHSPVGIIPRILQPALAVQCFYIISGFLIQLSIYRYKNESNKRWYLNFYASRFLRIFPLYWLCAIATFIFFHKNNINSYDLYENFIYAANNFLIIGQDILRFFSYDFAQKSFSLLPPYTENMGYIQNQYTVFGNGFSIMGQSWTLAVEIWFYLAAPFILFRSNIILLGIIVSSIVSRFIFAYYGYTHHTFLDGIIFNEIGIFLCGALSARFYKYWLENQKLESIFIGKLGILALPLLISYLCYGWRAFPGGAWGQGILDVPCKYWSVLVVVTILLPWIFYSYKDSQWDRALGDLSYPVYISHLLIIDSLQMIHISKKLISILAIPETILVAVIITYLVELPIDRWRHLYVKTKLCHPIG